MFSRGSIDTVTVLHQRNVVKHIRITWRTAKTVNVNWGCRVCRDQWRSMYVENIMTDSIWTHECHHCLPIYNHRLIVSQGHTSNSERRRYRLYFSDAAVGKACVVPHVIRCYVPYFQPRSWPYHVWVFYESIILQTTHCYNVTWLHGPVKGQEHYIIFKGCMIEWEIGKRPKVCYRNRKPNTIWKTMNTATLDRFDQSKSV